MRPERQASISGVTITGGSTTAKVAGSTTRVPSPSPTVQSTTATRPTWAAGLAAAPVRRRDLQPGHAHPHRLHDYRRLRGLPGRRDLQRQWRRGDDPGRDNQPELCLCGRRRRGGGGHAEADGTTFLDHPQGSGPSRGAMAVSTPWTLASSRATRPTGRLSTDKQRRPGNDVRLYLQRERSV